MKAVLIASTTIDWQRLDDTPWVPYEAGMYDPDRDPPDADTLAEFAGRACYESWSRPNVATATNREYLAHILEVEHYSLLKHASATFYVTGVSRSLLVELERHTYIALSVRSQRYVDESNALMIVPPALTRAAFDGAEVIDLAQLATDIRTAYTKIVDRLVARGLKRKQAREAARAVLPGATETRFVATGSLLAWRELIQKRTRVDVNGLPLADAEFHAFALEILRQLKELAPNSFGDM